MSKDVNFMLVFVSIYALLSEATDLVKEASAGNIGEALGHGVGVLVYTYTLIVGIRAYRNQDGGSPK